MYIQSEYGMIVGPTLFASFPIGTMVLLYLWLRPENNYCICFVFYLLLEDKTATSLLHQG